MRYLIFVLVFASCSNSSDKPESRTVDTTARVASKRKLGETFIPKSLGDFATNFYKDNPSFVNNPIARQSVSKKLEHEVNPLMKSGIIDSLVFKFEHIENIGGYKGGKYEAMFSYSNFQHFPRVFCQVNGLIGDEIANKLVLLKRYKIEGKMTDEFLPASIDTNYFSLPTYYMKISKVTPVE